MNPEDLLDHSNFVISLATRLIGDAHKAADIAQDTWVAALKNPPPPEKPLRKWLSRVVKNFVLLSRRSDGRRNKHERFGSDNNRYATPEEMAQKEETRRRLVRSVLGLKEPYRTTLILRFYEDLSIKKIASHLGIPVETAKTRVQRGLNRLRQRFDAECGGDGRTWILTLAPLTVSNKIFGGKLLAAAAVAAVLLIPVYFLISNFQKAAEKPGDLKRTAESEIFLHNPNKQNSKVFKDEIIPVSHHNSWIEVEDKLQNNGICIEGQVLDSRGNPSFQVKVSAIRHGTLRKPIPADQFSRFTAYTDELGKFNFSGLPQGVYKLRAHKDHSAGFLNCVAADSISHPLGASCFYTITLSPSKTLHGQILSSEGKPIKNAMVLALTPCFREPINEGPVSWDRTDSHGNFSLPHLIWGYCPLYVQAEGYGVHIEDCYPISKDNIKIRLNRGIFVTGHALINKRPMPGICVCIQGNFRFGGVSWETVTARDGSYILGPLPNDLSELDPIMAYGKGRVGRYPVTLKNLIPDLGIISDVDFILQKNSQLSGTVIDHQTGDPVSGIWVNASSKSDYWSPKYSNRYYALTDSKGKFSILAPSDSYRIWTSPSTEYAPKAHNKGSKVELYPGENRKNLEIHVNKGATALLTINDPSNKPVEKARIRVEIINNNTCTEFGILPRIVEKGKGAYALIGMQLGETYSIEVRHEMWKGRRIFLPVTQVEKTLKSEIKLSSSFTAHGRVQDIHGLPIPNASVNVADLYFISTDNKGRFQLKGMSSLEVWVLTEAAGYLENSLDVNFYANMPEIIITLYSLGPKTLKGVVKDDTGKPVPNANILVTQNMTKGVSTTWSCGNGDRSWTETKTDETGSFKVPGLYNSPFNIHVSSHLGWAMGMKRFMKSVPETLEITLFRNARIQGRLINALKGMMIQCRHLNNEDYSNNYLYVQPDGTFDFQIAPGKLEIMAKKHDFIESNPIRVDAKPGSIVKNIELEVKEAKTFIKGKVYDKKTGLPLKGVKVYLLHVRTIYGWTPGEDSYRRFSAITNEDGDYLIENPNPKQRFIILHHNDYCEPERREIKIIKGKNLEGVNFYLTPGCSIEGQIMSKGKGLIAVQTTVDSHTTAYRESKNTINDGRFSHARLTPGRNSLSFEISDVRISRSALISEGQCRTFNFHLNSSIEGVLRCQELPISNAAIYLKRVENNIWNEDTINVSGETHIEQNGAFIFPKLLNGRYYVTAVIEYNGVKQTTKKEIFVENNNAFVELSIESNGQGKVSGSIFRKGVPQIGIQIELHNKDNSLVKKTTTDEIGNYSFTDLPAGQMTIKVALEESKNIISRSFSLKNRASVQHDFLLEAGSNEIEVNIFHGDKESNSANIILRRLFNQGTEEDNIIERYGKSPIKFIGLPVGNYRIISRRPWLQEASIKISENELNRIDFKYPINGVTFRINLIIDSHLSSNDKCQLFIFEEESNLCEDNLHITDTKGFILEMDQGFSNNFVASGLSPGNYDLVLLITNNDQVLRQAKQKIQISNDNNICPLTVRF